MQLFKFCVPLYKKLYDILMTLYFNRVLVFEFVFLSVTKMMFSSFRIRIDEKCRIQEFQLEFVTIPQLLFKTTVSPSQEFIRSVIKSINIEFLVILRQYK